ncbi:MAG: potassium channel family protein [Acidimicrobiia bacterium]|nr:potassium channel family protein [Acidimicrobiia bacterium]
MLEFLAVVIGAAAVVAVLVDMVNTLVTTQTAQGRWWLTRRVYVLAWGVIRFVAIRLRTDAARERLLGTFAPVSVLLLLVVWVTQQVIGFGLIWWGVGGVTGVGSLFDAVYFSGVVYFTLGFGEIVPAEAVPRIGALVEALAGVLTTALVIGYLPSLYTAYSERERKLMLLDDGSEDRITPANLVLARAPDGDATQLFSFFTEWEEWIAGVIETHSTFPMLRLFRSKDPGQHWITALGVVTDAALTCQMMRGAENRAPYWLLRRSIRLFTELTDGVDLSEYRARLDEAYTEGSSEQFREMYDQLAAAGFDLLPIDEARTRMLELRRRFDAQMEWLIDMLLAPRGFWGHAIGHRMGEEEVASNE